MKTALLFTGIFTLIVSISHGFITEQSIFHSLLIHPLVVLLGFVLIALGLRKRDQFDKTRRNFSAMITPYVNEKLALAETACKRGNFETEFKFLEDAHVLGQQSTYLHTLVHWRMFIYGWRQRAPREMLGQCMRLVGALTKTAFGLLPTGNTGGSNVSAFKPMPISKENQAVLDKINNA